MWGQAKQAQRKQCSICFLRPSRGVTQSQVTSLEEDLFPKYLFGIYILVNTYLMNNGYLGSEVIKPDGGDFNTVDGYAAPG